MADEIEFGSDDVAIIVLGMTGSGKSTFIGQLVKNAVKVGHRLASCTDSANLYSSQWNDHRKLWLLDTPGFDDTRRNDADVLRTIVTELVALHKKVKIAGVIYLHPIVDLRMRGGARRNVALLRCLCGEDAYRRITLVTTMWERQSSDEKRKHVFEKRQEELINDDKTWGQIRGFTHERHIGTPDSAHHIIENLLLEHDDDDPCTLLIVQEISEKDMKLEETSAGREVNKELCELREELEQEKKTLQAEWNAALIERDDKHAEEIAQQKNSLEAKLKAAEQAQRTLKVKYEQMALEQAAEHEKVLKELEQDKLKTGNKIKELESDLKQAFEDREQERRRFEEERGVLESRIRQLEKGNDANRLKRVKAEKEKQEAYYMAARKRKEQDVETLQESKREVAKEYEQVCAAVCSRRNFIFVLNVNVLGKIWQWRKP